MSRGQGRSSGTRNEPDQLLDGEDPDTRHPDDAEHWFKVYTELVQAKADLLAALSGRLAEMKEEESRQELAKADTAMLQAELDRFQRRLDFWRGRWEAVRQ